MSVLARVVVSAPAQCRLTCDSLCFSTFACFSRQSAIARQQLILFRTFFIKRSLVFASLFEYVFTLSSHHVSLSILVNVTRAHHVVHNTEMSETKQVGALAFCWEVGDVITQMYIIAIYTKQVFSEKCVGVNQNLTPTLSKVGANITATFCSSILGFYFYIATVYEIESNDVASVTPTHPPPPHTHTQRHACKLRAYIYTTHT